MLSTRPWRGFTTLSGTTSSAMMATDNTSVRRQWNSARASGSSDCHSVCIDICSAWLPSTVTARWPTTAL
ncbi:hypothetical protein D3C79_976180 [compost metagenome]